MDDLPDKLRKHAKYVMPLYPKDVCSRAAAEIERLRAALWQIETDDDVHCPNARAIAHRALEQGARE